MGRKGHVGKNNVFSLFPRCLEMYLWMYLCIQYMVNVVGGNFRRGENLKSQRKAVAQKNL